MHNPRQSQLTSIRDTLLSAALTGEVPFSRTLIPNPDHLVPPGYYVSATEGGPCGHCGAPEAAHLDAARFCPVPPLEFRVEDRAA